MSGTPALSTHDFHHLYHDTLKALCAATTPMELFEHLAKTLHDLIDNQPVALYRRLGTKKLCLAYCFPPPPPMGPYNQFLAIRCIKDLTDSDLQHYELKGEFGTWGYIGHPITAYSEPTQWAQLLIEIAAQRLRLLKAERMAKRQQGLKTRRKLLSSDIKRLTSLVHILQLHGDSWCDIFQADGIVLAYQNELHCFGTYPPKQQLSQQLQELSQHSPPDEVAELDGSCQGGLVAPLSLAGTHLGWLLLFRLQPLTSIPVVDAPVQASQSYWSPLEAPMIVELADDLAVAITALEVVYLNRQLIKTNQRLEGLARTDPLTKCWNRYYTELVIEELGQSATPFALLMFDIDNFKKINDTYGHSVGDDILCDITHLVQKTLRSNDHLGRWGGEEFIVITQGLGQEASLQLANRLCRHVEEHTFSIADRVTISIGLTLIQPDDQPRQLLERVDKGMYLAKTTGKNRVVMC